MITSTLPKLLSIREIFKRISFFSCTPSCLYLLLLPLPPSLLIFFLLLSSSLPPPSLYPSLLLTLFPLSSSKLLLPSLPPSPNPLLNTAATADYKIGSSSLFTPTKRTSPRLSWRRWQSWEVDRDMKCFPWDAALTTPESQTPRRLLLP